MMTTANPLAVIESQPQLHQIISQAVGEHFSEVLHLQSASACLENPVHAVYLVDLMLEDMDGLSLIEDLRMKNRHVPIAAFLTQQQSEQLDMDEAALRKMATDSGANAVFTAPFNLAEITQTLLRLSQQAIEETA